MSDDLDTVRRDPVSDPGQQTAARSGWARAIPAIVVVAVLAALPFMSVRIPVVFSGELSSPGVLNLLALCLVFGALALTYDLLFGFTGLLSFGHALYFALGVYVTAIAVTEFGWSLLAAVGLTMVVGLIVPIVLGAISLRVGDIAFAMVTLAFAQAGHIFVMRDPLRLTGGEEGLALAYQRLPGIFVGVFNTKYVYWLALGFAVLVYVVSRWAVDSRPGRIWQAIRENEQRVEVIGLEPYGFKLASFVVSSFLAALGGVVYVLLVGGAHPGITAATFTLTLLVMVVLGGTGTLWGAVLGGVLYTYLNNRLVSLSNSATVQDLPDVLSRPLSEPLFILGALFVVLVMFFPGGIAGLRDTAVGDRLRRLLGRLVPAREGADDG
ncbi:MAG: branched-chain amino acid ABC transporter permease [Nitriliruptorales bacterium]|nr:branched-chain amino acid ABC transporter permease [Nitriliruptorales bacterium]